MAGTKKKGSYGQQLSVLELGASKGQFFSSLKKFIEVGNFTWNFFLTFRHNRQQLSP